MGIAYLGMGVGGALVPIISTNLESNLGWQNALSILGLLIVVIAFPLAFFIKDKSPAKKVEKKQKVPVKMKSILKNPNFYLLALVNKRTCI